MVPRCQGWVVRVHGDAPHSWRRSWEASRTQTPVQVSHQLFHVRQHRWQYHQPSCAARPCVGMKCPRQKPHSNGTNKGAGNMTLELASAMWRGAVKDCAPRPTTQCLNNIWGGLGCLESMWGNHTDVRVGWVEFPIICYKLHTGPVPCALGSQGPIPWAVGSLGSRSSCIP